MKHVVTGGTGFVGGALVFELLDKTTLSLPAGDDQKRPPRSVQATVVYDQALFVDSAVSNVRDAIPFPRTPGNAKY